MTGPLVLGTLGAALVFVGLLAQLVFVRADSPRYKLDLLNTYDGGAEVKKMVQDTGRMTAALALGAAMQFAAVIWQES